MCAVHCAQVIDLLNSNQRTYLAVRWSRHKGFYVENLFHVECESIEDLFAVLEEGKLISLSRLLSVNLLSVGTRDYKNKLWQST